MAGGLVLQSCVAKLEEPGSRAPTKKTRGRVVVGGSKKSLRRLSLLLGAVDWESYKRNVLFLTLTLPEEVHNADVFAVALDRLRKWLLRRYPEAGAVCRIEQGGKGGRLHAHVLLFGAGWIPVVTLRSLWKRCLRCNVTPRVHIEVVRNGNAMAAYLCKYIAKVASVEAPREHAAQGVEGSPGAAEGGSDAAQAAVSLSTSHIWQGRVWQVWGRERIRYAPGVVFALDKQGLAKIKRVLRRLWSGYKTGALFVQPDTVRKLRQYAAEFADPFPMACNRCCLF